MCTKWLQAVLLAISLCLFTIDYSQAARRLPVPEAVRIYEVVDPPSGLSDKNVAMIERRHTIAEYFVRLDAGGLLRAFDTGEARPYEVPIRFAGDITFDIVVEDIEPLTPNGARITGSVASDPLSQVSIVVSPPYIVGSLQTTQRTFEFLPMQDGISLFVEIDHRGYPGELDPGNAHRRPEFDEFPHPDMPGVVGNAGAGATFVGPEPIAGEPFRNLDADTPQLNVLVLASQHEFDCTDEWRDDIAEAYSADLDFVFTQFLTSNVIMQCVDVVEEDHWNSIAEPYAVVFERLEAETWRSDAAADVVVMLLADGLDSCGYSVGPNYPDYPIAGAYQNFFSQYAYLSMVAEECAIGNKSLAHELGHLFGMQHERFSESGGVSDFCGYGYPIMLNCLPISRTIMAYDGYCTFVNGRSCKRAPLYSIPISNEPVEFGGLSFGGLVTGQTCTSESRNHLEAPANNMNQLQFTAGDVADYWEVYTAMAGAGDQDDDRQ